MSYRVLAHTADTGIEVEGETLEDLLVNAAHGMFALMYEPVEASPVAIDFAVSEEGLEELFVQWLSELLFLSESREVAFNRFEVHELSEQRVVGEASGIPYASARLIGPPIKAVTYHQLELGETADGWRARVIFDV